MRKKIGHCILVLGVMCILWFVLFCIAYWPGQERYAAIQASVATGFFALMTLGAFLSQIGPFS